MVPGNDLLRLDENYHSFGSLDRYGLASTIIQGAIVALPDCLAYALDERSYPRASWCSDVR